MRNMRRWWRSAALLLMVLAASALRAQFNGTTPTSAPGLNVRHPLTTDPAILYPLQRETRLMVGDVMLVNVYGVLPLYADTERVSQDGTIRLNLGGVVHVEGLSLKEAEQAISTRFEEAQTFHNAQVSITLTEAPAHVATVVGFGMQRGVVPVTGPTRLYQVLASAGGLPVTSSTMLTIDRPGNAEPIFADIGSDPAHSAGGNIPIFPGDTIAVGTVGQVFVVGAVNRPAAIPLSGSTPTTILKAVTAAGGTTFPAKSDDTKLVRMTGDKRTVIDVHLSQIMNGKQEDIMLQSDDIVLVPSSAIRTVIKNGGITTAIALVLAVQTFRQ